MSFAEAAAFGTAYPSPMSPRAPRPDRARRMAAGAWRGRRGGSGGSGFGESPGRQGWPASVSPGGGGTCGQVHGLDRPHGLHGDHAVAGQVQQRRIRVRAANPPHHRRPGRQLVHQHPAAKLPPGQGRDQHRLRPRRADVSHIAGHIGPKLAGEVAGPPRLARLIVMPGTEGAMIRPPPRPPLGQRRLHGRPRPLRPMPTLRAAPILGQVHASGLGVRVSAGTRRPQLVGVRRWWSHSTRTARR